MRYRHSVKSDKRSTPEERSVSLCSSINVSESTTDTKRWTKTWSQARAMVEKEASEVGITHNHVEGFLSTLSQ